MSCYDNAREFRSKIEKALAEENLVLTIKDKQYPITLIISQSQSPAAQMDLLADADGGVSSKDSALRFVFELDGIMIHTDNRLIITDAFMTKLKGLAKKWHTAFTHAYFADHINQQAMENDTEPDCEHSADDAEEQEEAEDFPDEECAEALAGSIDVPEEIAEDFPADDADHDPFADLLAEAEDEAEEE